MRRLFAFTLLPLLILLGLGLNWMQGQRHRAPALPPAVAQGHGLRMANLDLAGLDADAIRQRVAVAAADGYAVIRVRLPWDEVQPQPDSWRWQGLEESLALAQRHGLEVLLVLDGSPAWAREAVDAENPLAPPHDIRDFGAFAARVAQRSQGRVQAYQIWDEPNIAPHWGNRWVDAAAYTRLLREAALSIRRIDPQASIVLATLAPTTAHDGANLSDLDYLRQLYTQGAGQWFDALAVNALGFDLPPDDPPAVDRLNFRRPELLAAIMAENGDAAKPVWITRWGWWVPTADYESSPWGQISADTLPSTMQQGWEWAQLHWPWAGPMAWITYWPGPASDPMREGFALRNAGGLTPAGAAMQALSTLSLAGVGRWTVASAPVQMAPRSWRLSPVAADPAGSEAELTLRWQGEALALTVQRGPYWGVIRAWIDGRPAPALPQDENGDAYLLLYDLDAPVVTVPLVRSAGAGEHELRLRISGGWGQWPLREIVILAAPWPRPWPTLPFMVGLLLALLWSLRGCLQAWRRPAGRRVLAQVSGLWQQATTWFAAWHPAWHVPLAFALLIAFYLAPQAGLSLLLLALLAALLAMRLPLAVWLIIVALPFYTHPKMLGPIGLPLHELLIWLALGIAVLHWGLMRLQNRSSALFALAQGWQGLDWPVFGLLTVGALAMLGAQRPGFALYDWRITLLTPTAFYFFLTRLRVARPELTRTAADALVLSVLLLSVLGLRQWALGQAIFAEGVPRISAIFGSPNNLALYVGRVWPMLVLGTWLGINDQADVDWRRLFYGLGFVLVSIIALLTFSKGLLLISMPLALILLALAEKRLRRPVLILFGLGILALLPFLRTERFRDLLNTRSGTTFLRLQLWQSAWRMWRDHPWFGVGPDNFLYAYRSSYALPSAWEELNLSHPHNLILDLLTRLGIGGLLAGLALVGQSIWSGLALWRRRLTHDRPDRRLLLGLWVGFVAGMAHGLIDNSLFLADLSVLTLVVVALLRLHANVDEHFD